MGTEVIDYEPMETKEEVWVKVRLPQNQHRRLKAQAANEGRTVQGFVLRVINEYLEWAGTPAPPATHGQGSPEAR